jgi:hypothetical protein
VVVGNSGSPPRDCRIVDVHAALAFTAGGPKQHQAHPRLVSPFRPPSLILLHPNLAAEELLVHSTRTCCACAGLSVPFCAMVMNESMLLQMVSMVALGFPLVPVEEAEPGAPVARTPGVDGPAGLLACMAMCRAEYEGCEGGE